MEDYLVDLWESWGVGEDVPQAIDEGAEVDEGSGTRQRRGSAEIDQLVLGAARSVFAGNGYAGTTMRDVAQRAGVHEPMVYRRYGTKARLFEAAVLDPLDEAVRTYLETWAAQAEVAGPVQDLTRSWVPALYEVFRDERQLIMALMGAGDYPSSENGALTERLRRMVQRMLPQAEVEIERRSMTGIALPENIVVSVGMILGVALIDAERSFGLSEARVIEEMVQMTLFGVTARGGVPDDRAPRRTADTERAQNSPLDLGPEIDRLLDRVADAERRATRAELERDLLRRRLERP
jgi:AcrR family transcriptional regulator